MDNIPTLVRTFGEQKRWVNWVAKEVEGRITKVPLAKSDDPTTWVKYADLPNKEQVGIMFGMKKNLLGIDIDHCLNGQELVDDERREAIFDLLKVADTYTEISPSGTGLHLFLQIDGALDLISNRKGGYECYTTGRYFTVTNQPYGGDKPVRIVSIDEANEILSIIGYPWKADVKQSTDSLTRSAEKSPTLDDETVLKKLFSGKNKDKVLALYNGDTSQNDNDDSSADLALCMHLAFYTGKNAEQMERLWLGSPIGNRKKTQERKDYRARTISAAIDKTSEVYIPREKKVLNPESVAEGIAPITLEDMGLYFTLDKEGNKKYSLIQENINIILEKHPHFAGRFRRDEFLDTDQLLINGEWVTQRDIHEVLIQSELSKVLPMFNRVSPTMIQRAIQKVAHDNRMDSGKNYITSLTWDGVPRIDQWLQNVFHVADDEYTRKVGSNWIKGLADRLAHPGCQFDYVLVVEGGQGAKKSSVFRQIVLPDWHLETERSPGEKDFFVEMTGKAVIELSEGQSNASVDVKKMKSIITKRKDTYRSPYGRTSTDHPRRSVFCMTTNDDDYLKDTTGDRRWWPVTSVGQADVQWVTDNRDQMFAEAYHRITVLKETTYEVPEHEALERQEDRRQKDANTDSIVAWYLKQNVYKRKEGVSTLDVYIGAFFGGEKPQNLAISRLHQISIASVLTTTLRLKKRRTMVEGMRTYRFYDPKLDDMPEVFALHVEGSMATGFDEKVEEMKGEYDTVAEVKKEEF